MRSSTALSLMAAVAAAGLSVRPAPAQWITPVHEYFEPTTSTSSTDPTLPRLPSFAARVGDAAAHESASELGESTQPLVYTPTGALIPPATFGEGVGGLRNGSSARTGDIELDRDTGPEGALRYAVVYSPTVSPWKRSNARSAVIDRDGVTVLGPTPTAAHPIALDPRVPEGHDVFVGALRVLARAGEAIPIPSVSPEMQIQRVVVRPNAHATMARDGDDNFMLVLDDSGPFDVELHVSAPRSYFGGPPPETSSRLRAPLAPPTVVERARPVITAVGLSPELTEVEATTRLASYFRAFEALSSAPSPRSLDPYLDIALERRGVCRHRAQAFVITAAAVGLEARYVANEAHAFVEVRWTGHGWRRIDLGGASSDFELVGAAVPTHHFHGDATVDGTTDDHQTASDTIEGDDDPTVDRGPAAADPDSADQDSADQETADPDSADQETVAMSAQSEDPSIAEPYARDPLPEIDVWISRETSRIYRGQSVRVEGMVAGVYDATAQRADHVELAIQSDEGVRYTLARLPIETDGSFGGDVAIPESLPVGRWVLRGSLSAAGDASPNGIP